MKFYFKLLPQKDADRNASSVKAMIKIRLLQEQPYMSLMRKTVFGVSDQVRHKPGCTATEDDKRLEISDLGSRGIVLYE